MTSIQCQETENPGNQLFNNKKQRFYIDIKQDEDLQVLKKKQLHEFVF